MEYGEVRIDQSNWLLYVHLRLSVAFIKTLIYNVTCCCWWCCICTTFYRLCYSILKLNLFYWQSCVWILSIHHRNVKLVTNKHEVGNVRKSLREFFSYFESTYNHHITLIRMLWKWFLTTFLTYNWTHWSIVWWFREANNWTHLSIVWWFREAKVYTYIQRS